jgi:hypothetical protein
VMSKETQQVKIIKTMPRRFRYDDDRDVLLAPAEYEVRVNDERRGIIIKAQDGWRVCRPTPSSRIGMAISPVGLDAFRKVRAWAVEFFSKKKKGGGGEAD